MSAKLTTYLVTIEEPYEGLGLQQDPLECTTTYVVRITDKQHENLLNKLQDLEIENTEDYEYKYEDHYGILAYRVAKQSKLRGKNEYPALLKLLKWRTPKPNGPQGMLLNKGKEDEDE
jgi:hypothetical protein